MKDGKMGTDEWSGARWCAACNAWHGPLYNCEKYPQAIRAAIIAEAEEWETRLRDPKWCEKQIRRGTPPKVIAIFKMFAGRTAEKLCREQGGKEI